ncbi:glycosyltransferase involved in cell wall biosynthesis [Devosia subaequoris]|uniref:Glycosyltransferase involved in cell wall biosynthesis n=1 Tax=Devosia subaequoris TaxID=395930 RepID=A0A7W6IQ47_9HYPH|nr:glycosyltransferase [Devosia subaequoris]MBB4053777.1 glycosyltransferase involved in cell wall biosynthesis [Devosia subaequoris]MCP1211026.1 glycosyltransferase [Devosia subaequoris]
MPSGKVSVLLSAMAFSPTRGSEFGVGWRWALEIADLGYDVTVLTRTRHKPEIATALGEIEARSIKLEFVDPWSWVEYNVSPVVFRYLYIYVWQIAAYLRARQIHRMRRYDVVHHVTFGGIRFPSLMGLLGIPFVFGTLGGGESTPPGLFGAYPLKERLWEWARTISNAVVRFDPLMRWVFGSASVIALRTPDNIPLVPFRMRSKVVIAGDVGSSLPKNQPARQRSQTVRFLYVGRLIYLKGIQLALPAFAIAKKVTPNISFTIVGSGPAEKRWQSLSQRLRLEDIVTFVGHVPHTQISQVYSSHDVFMFPSMHDSGGTVVLEAAAHGLPIICLNTGGPGHILGAKAGTKIDVSSGNQNQVVKDIARAIAAYATNTSQLDALGSDARDWSSAQTWRSRVLTVYNALPKALAPSLQARARS